MSMMESKKNSKVTLKTLAEKDFQTTLSNIYKFVKINPEMYSEFDIIHLGEETFKQLGQNCLLNPTDEEKKSAEFLQTVRSFDFEICNAHKCDKMDFNATYIQNKRVKTNKTKFCEQNSNDCEDEDEMTNIENHVDELLKMDQSNMDNSSSIKASLDQVRKPNTNTVNEVQTVKNLKLESKENERFGNNENIAAPTKHDMKVFTSDDVLDLIICDAEYPSLLPPEYCNADPLESEYPGTGTTTKIYTSKDRLSEVKGTFSDDYCTPKKGAEKFQSTSSTDHPLIVSEMNETCKIVTGTHKNTDTKVHSVTDPVMSSETNETSEKLNGTPKNTDPIHSDTDHPLMISEIKSPVKKISVNIASMRKWMDHTFTKRKSMLITKECAEIVRKYPGFQYLVVVKDEYNRITGDNGRIAALEEKLGRRFNKLLRVNPRHNSLLESVLDKYNENICSPHQDAKKTAATLILCISLSFSLDALITFQDNKAAVKVPNGILYPKMIVFGDPFLKCRVTVFTDNVPILELDNVFDGLIAVYCLYYIFNISYGSSVKRLMEYLDFLVGLDQNTFSVDLFKGALKLPISCNV